MNAKSFALALAIVAMSIVNVSAASAGQAENEEVRLANVVVTVAPAPAATFVAPPTRPAVMPVLYATLGGLQALDIYSTKMAINAGAREANPVAAPFAGGAASMAGLKIASTAGTILFAERVWKKNKVAAVVMLAAVNGATAIISMNNLRNARAAGRR